MSDQPLGYGFCRRDGAAIKVVKVPLLKRLTSRGRLRNKVEVFNEDGSFHRDPGYTTLDVDVMSVR